MGKRISIPAYAVAVLFGIVLALSLWGCVPTPPYIEPMPPPDPWVPPVPPDPPDPVDPIPDGETVTREAYDAIPIGADKEAVREALGSPYRTAVIDGLETWVYLLEAPVGATGELRFSAGKVAEKSIW